VLLHGYRGHVITVERRIDWAEQRLTELWAAIDAYLAREPVDVRVEDVGPGSYVFRGYVREQPPDEFSLMVGDFSHQLRASLDNLVWEVAGATATRPNLLAFLISETADDFSDRRHRVLAGVDPAIVFAIGTCQPFVKPDQGGLSGGDRLQLLDDFWNDDKHRVPATVLAAVEGSASTWTGDDIPPAIQRVRQYFGDGEVLARLDGWHGNRWYVENARPIFDLRFITLRAPDHPVMRYAFRAMVDMVRKEILPRFAAFR
jgi:hypothetical protein